MYDLTMPSVADVLCLLIAGLPTLAWAAALVATVRLTRGVESLDPGPGARDTRATVVTPACDEAAGIGAAVESFLAQGPAVDVVAIDDRSTDQTGVILDDLARETERLTVLHIDTLPPGWLGKLHALDRGTQRATGDWLVFADADVVFEPDTIARAIGHAAARELDCLALIPQVRSAGPLGDLVFEAAGAFIGVTGRWWEVRDPERSAFAGGGAFILVRREAFERTPGFAWLRLEVADDMGLGQMMKHHGRADIALAGGAVSLRWYRDYADIARKMQKNFFGIVGGFSVARTLAAAALLAWLGAFPAAALLPTSTPWPLVIPAAGLACLCASAILTARWLGRSTLSAALAPLGLLLMSAVIVRAAWVGHRVGGIEWRGQRYASDELKPAQRVRW